MTMTSAALLARAHDGGVGDDEETLGRPKRRRFTAEYKLAIVAEYEALTDPGAKGALLRREGLYSSHIVEWRRARDAGALRELAPMPAILEIPWSRSLKFPSWLRAQRVVAEASGCRA
jgi:transposase-like protein